MGGFKRKGWSVESLVGRNGGKDREPTPSFGEGALGAQKEPFPEGVGTKTNRGGQRESLR